MLLDAFLPYQALSLDYRGGVIRVLAEPDSTSDQRRLIEAAVKHGVRTAPAIYHSLGVDVKQNGFPYTVHVSFDKPHKLLSSLDNKIQLVTINASELRLLRQVFDGLLAHVSGGSKVITFALGGVTALNFITHAMLQSKPQSTNKDRVGARKQLEEMFHLFGGISWRKTAPFNFNKEQFLDWLDRQPDSSGELVVFDTSFSGSAIDKLKKLFPEYAESRERFPFATVHLVAIRESVTPIDEEHVPLQSPNGSQVPMKVTYLTVPDLITEDQNELVGYDALKQDDTFAAIGINAILRVVDDNGRCVAVAGGGDVAGFVQRWLHDSPPTTPLAIAAERALVYAAISQILDNQRSREREIILEMANRGVLDKSVRDESLILVEKRFEGAKKRERKAFAIGGASWRQSPQLILHQLKQKGKVVAKIRRAKSARNR